MPIVKYRLQIGDDVFDETETFTPTRDTFELIEKVSNMIVRPMQDHRKRLGELGVSLLKVEVTNPYVHLHDWQRTHVNKFGMRAYYYCQRCKITGWKRLHSTGEHGNDVTRDDKWSHPKYDLCRDKLKPLPSIKKFF